MANVEYKNASGYPDPTAQKGLKPVIRDEKRIIHDKTVLVKDFQAAAHSAGFEVEGRVVLRHKRTGKVFK